MHDLRKLLVIWKYFRSTHYLKYDFELSHFEALTIGRTLIDYMKYLSLEKYISSENNYHWKFQWNILKKY